MGFNLLRRPNLQDRLAPLDVVAVAQENLRNFLSVDEGTVGRTQVAQEAARRSNFQETMMP